MRTIRYRARLALVLTIVFMLTINTANACWLFRRRCVPRRVCTPVVYISPACVREVIVHEGVVIRQDRPAVKSPRDQGINAASMEEETAESSPVDVAPPEIAFDPMPEPATEPTRTDDVLAEPIPSVGPVEFIEPPMDTN